MEWIPTREEIERFQAMVAQRLGLQFDEGKRDFLSGILHQRVQEVGGKQASFYFALLSSGNGNGEWRVLAEQLTVGETYFFRNKDQFRALAESVLPFLFQARAENRRIRILSAGCATGEEAYSIAMLLQQRFAGPAGWEVKILGVDINPAVVEKAKRGLYPGWSLRETDDEFKSRFFRSEGREFVLDEAIRSAVSFEEKNLTADDPALWQTGPFDLVFCRNVTMYFVPAIARAVIARIGRALAPDGYLFLGHAETLRGISNDFHLCHTHETFYYQHREGAPACQGVLPDIAPVPAVARFSVPLPLESDVSWVDAIQRASERIASLALKSGQADGPAMAKAPAAAEGVRGDLSSSMELLVKERFAEALESFHALPQEARQDADAQLLHAVLLTNAGQLDKAEAICGQILKHDEMNAGAHYLMALCREHRGDRPAAAEHDQAATYLDSGFAMPHFHLGLMARRSGDLETARRELATALPMLLREDASRILLFGGGFNRDALVALCRAELLAAGGSA